MRKSFWLLSAGLMAISVPAYAQEGVQPQPDSAPETTSGSSQTGSGGDQTSGQPEVTGGDIIVTANRRNEALSNVPMAISAVTAESLKNTGATDIRQLQQVSPSLLVTSTQSEAGASTARIRGIGTVGDNPGLESSVGVFIDGVYRSRTGVGLTELGPLDRVEVLRGPQGTLFGRNTSAGLISIITARPRFQPEFAGELTVGNYNMRRVELSGTGGLSDTLAARLDGVYLKRSGFVEDLVSGRDINDRDRWMLRGQLMYQPSDDLSVRLIGDYSNRDEECCAAPYLPASDFTAAGGRGPSTFKPLMEALGAIVPDDPFERKVAITPGRSYRGDVKDWGLSAEAVYDMGAVELTSITAYRDNDLVRGTDVDYSNLDLAYRPDDGSVFNRFKTFTQEVRLQGSAGPLDWLVGGYYASENLRSVDSINYGADYSRLLNCYSAYNFAALLTAGGVPASVTSLLPAPGTATCFNTPVAAMILPGLPAAQQPIFAAFARLGAFAPGPMSPFGNSGFENLVRAQVPGQLGFVLNDAGFYDDFRQKSNNLALFTHNIYSFTDALKLTVGARYTKETKRLDAQFTDNNFGCTVFSGSALAQLPCAIPSSLAGDFGLDGKRTENNLSGTAVLSYKPTDQILTYASYSRGYKAGGFNLDRSALSRQLSLNSFGQQIAGGICPPTGPQPAGCAAGASADQLEFRPETNDAVELGLKYNGPGIDVNVAAFNQLFRDFQLNTFNGVNFVVENINSCKDDLGGADTDNVTLPAETGACPGGTRAGVRTRGVEFELFSRPLPDLSFNFGATIVETRYRKNLVGAGGRPLSTALFQLPGRRVSNAAGVSLTSSLAWTPRIGSSGMTGLAYVDVRRQSEFNTGSDLDIEKVENGYTTVNARVGLRGRDQAWAIELWAQNLFNEKVKQIAFDAFLQGNCTERGAANGFCSPTFGTTRSNQLFGVFLGEPRMYGLTLRGKFGPSRAIAPVYVAPPAPPPPPAPATQTCPDGSVILATDICPAPPPPPPPPPPVPERG